MDLKYHDDGSGFFDENPLHEIKFGTYILSFILGSVGGYILLILISLLFNIDDSTLLLIPLCGLFGTLVTLGSQIKRVEAESRKLAQQNSEIIKQNEELKALILDISNKNENE